MNHVFLHKRSFVLFLSVIENAFLFFHIYVVFFLSSTYVLHFILSLSLSIFKLIRREIIRVLLSSFVYIIVQQDLLWLWAEKAVSAHFTLNGSTLICWDVAFPLISFLAYRFYSKSFKFNAYKHFFDISFQFHPFNMRFIFSKAWRVQMILLRYFQKSNSSNQIDEIRKSQYEILIRSVMHVRLVGKRKVLIISENYLIY